MSEATIPTADDAPASEDHATGTPATGMPATGTPAAGPHDVDGSGAAEIAGQGGERPHPPSSRARSLVVWVPAAKPPVVTALAAADIRISDDPDQATRAVVSTRLPRHRVSEFNLLARSHNLPVVILVHPGGETAAVEALRNGADTAIAEGDVLALRALAGDPDAVSSRIGNLLEAYETRLGRQSANGSSRAAGSVISTVSGLPGHGALRARLSSAVVDVDQEIRLVSIGVPGLARPHALRLGADAVALLHRRIAIGLRNLAAGRGELFDLGEGAFVLVAPRLGVDDAERLGRAIIDLVEAYTPDAHSPLTAAIGHAGSECSTDLPTLRELSGRAELTAVSDERSAVLGAGELVGPLATATELEVTLRLAAIADELGTGPSHTAVAQVANDLAVRLGFEGTERLLVRFCAHVAGIGRVLGNDRGADAPDPLVVAARHVGATAGPAVAAALLHLRERWDGSGTPDGLAGADIPAPARIIAVAEALVTADGDLAALQEGAGTLYDPTVVAAAAELARSS